MRRVILLSSCVALAIALLGPSTAAASGACPPSPSGFVLYEIHGSAENPGPAPAPGTEPLWDDTVVAPFVAMFGSLEAGLEALGFASADELYAFVLAGWYSWDRNGDHMICMQDTPDTPGIPAYIFNAIDNSARVR